jgi:hypothetical protein
MEWIKLIRLFLSWQKYIRDVYVSITLEVQSVRTVRDTLAKALGIINSITAGSIVVMGPRAPYL